MATAVTPGLQQTRRRTAKDKQTKAPAATALPGTPTSLCSMRMKIFGTDELCPHIVKYSFNVDMFYLLQKMREPQPGARQACTALRDGQVQQCPLQRAVPH